MTPAKKLVAILEIIEEYGQHDGGHHKQWCLDQIARIVHGAGYGQWVKHMCNGEDGPNTYDYDEGIAP